MISFDLPIKTVSEANSSEHWTVKAKRHRQQQWFVRLAYWRYLPNIVIDTKEGDPCFIINLIRIAPRKLDDDNLVSAFKWIRDELSELLIPEKAMSYIDKKGKTKKLKGRADSDERILWKYDQLTDRAYSIRVEITYVKRTLLRVQKDFPEFYSAIDPDAALELKAP